MTDAERGPDLGFHSDEDGELCMHSDDPASAAWTVEVVGKYPGDDSHRAREKRHERGVALPALNYHIPFSAWFVGRHYCHLELTDEHGAHRILGTCPHTTVS